ncbi:MAG: thioredoxin domain-containing protein [Candidatus Nanopelagicales bacterium]
MPPLRDVPPDERGTVSPYLDQHIGNPVDWYAWGPDAFAVARERDVPIFLSIGYSACHWCHVMAHESFEDPVTARMLNDHFVSIKVDREERPDVDAVYIAAVTAMTGSAGWPLSAWLDHDGRVFHAGTYFPPEPRRGQPAFTQVLAAVTDAWDHRRADVLRSAAAINEALAERDVVTADTDDDGAPITADAVRELAATFDRVDGGFGRAPKFPPSMVLQFLLRHHENSGDPESLVMVTATADAMARGGLHDQLGGGFARYCVDRTWTVPHFEKMLYDNALLLMAYTDLWRVTDEFRPTVESTADFLIRDLRTAEGGFAAALDADSPPPDDPAGTPVEGAYYAWTPDQLDAVLGPEDGQWAAEHFAVTVAGNFEHGTSVLTGHTDPDDGDRFERVRAALLAARGHRPPPHRDDKIVAAWNGLTITALVRAGIALDRPDWVAAAEAAGRLLRDRHLVGDRLVRVSRDGRRGDAPGMLEDYGNVIVAFAWLAAATADTTWFTLAERLTDVMVDQFHDEGFADTAADAERLVRRPRDPSDNATPSGVSAALSALMIMSGLADRDDWRTLADTTLSSLAGLQRDHPRFAGWSLAVRAARESGTTEVAIVTTDDDPGDELLRAAVRYGPAGVVVARGPSGSVPLLAGKTADRRSAAYVCSGSTCSPPVTRDDDLAALLGR